MLTLSVKVEENFILRALFSLKEGILECSSHKRNRHGRGGGRNVGKGKGKEK